MDGDKTIITSETEEKKYNPERIALSIFSSSLLLFLVFFAFNSYFSNSIATASLEDSIYHENGQLLNINNEEVSAAESISVEDNSLTINSNEDNKYVFDAKSAIVIEVSPDSSKIVFESNKDNKLPIASLTKLMTSLIVLEKYDLNIKTTIDEAAMSQIGEQGVLKLGEILSVKDLLYISLMESSNRAAYALSEIVGVDNFITLMNQKADELGMKNTYFADSSGLNPNSQSSVYDLAILSEYLYKTQPLFREIISLKEYDLYLENGSFHHKLINTNNLLGIFPGLLGGKTGFTNEARGCYMVINKVYPNDQTYFINIILGSEDRSSAIKYLMDNFNS